MKENNDIGIIIVLLSLIAAAVFWVWGFAVGLEEPWKEAIFEDCRELKIDTVSYSYESDSYVIKVTKVR